MKTKEEKNNDRIANIILMIGIISMIGGVITGFTIQENFGSAMVMCSLGTILIFIKLLCTIKTK